MPVTWTRTAKQPDLPGLFYHVGDYVGPNHEVTEIDTGDGMTRLWCMTKGEGAYVAEWTNPAGEIVYRCDYCGEQLPKETDVDDIIPRENREQPNAEDNKEGIRSAEEAGGGPGGPVL